VTTVTLDCRNLRCPMPIVKISQAVKTMACGERLLVEASDAAFKVDLEAWVRRMGQRLVEFHDGAVQRALIEKVGRGSDERR
jgi:tRNA 2-thiouridine synthesizing protein A